MRAVGVDTRLTPIRNVTKNPRGVGLTDWFGNGTLEAVDEFPESHPLGIQTGVHVTRNGVVAQVSCGSLISGPSGWAYWVYPMQAFSVNDPFWSTSGRFVVPAGQWSFIRSESLSSSTVEALHVGRADTPSTSIDFYATGGMCQPGSLVTGYVDGDLPGGKWVGDSNASASIGYPTLRTT